jgi:hypothetical protein
MTRMAVTLEFMISFNRCFWAGEFCDAIRVSENTYGNSQSVLPVMILLGLCPT